jgi:hypothetical protein
MKRASSGALALILLMVALVAAPMRANAAGGESAADGEPVSTVELTYTLYMGGISLGKIDLSARIQGDGYRAVSTLETSGVVNAFWRAKIEASSRGTLIPTGVTPGVYDAFSQSGSNPARREMTLTYGGPVPAVKSNRGIPEMSDDHKKATLDPVSAMVFLVTSSALQAQKPCSLQAPVYDGRRRYDVHMSHVRKQDVKMDNGLYAGPVQVCRLRYTPVAGPRQRIYEGDKYPELDSWLTSAQSSTDPERQFVVPLRIFSQTQYGMFVALATRAVVDGKPLGKS